MNREAQHVYDLIVKPVLPLIGLDSLSARMLLVCTGQVETAYDNLRQVLPSGNYGEGHGWWSQQQNSYTQCLKYLNKNTYLKDRILAACFLETMPDINALVWNVRFALCMARIHYWQFKEPLPKADDLEALGRYWLRYYNGNGQGKGTLERFIAECKELIRL
jgi:hypothetical protein